MDLKNTILTFFHQYRFFWQLRMLWQRLIFWIGARIFRLQYSVQTKKDGLSGLRHLFQITQLHLFLALLFALFLQVTNSVVIEFYSLSSFKIPDDGDYVTFLATISGIGGVFIGLYYTAISTTAGSIYAKVPNNIRDLLAQERLGNMYMHFLSFVTFLGVSLVSFRLLGLERILIAVPIMLLFAGVGIISFVKLGQRVFYLFDPTALSHNLFVQLSHLVKLVTVGGYHWEDAAFQRHFNRLASSNFDALETLADITKKEIHLSGDPFITLAKNIISFLLFYEESKNRIPSNSEWYEKKYSHIDWYRTDESRVSMAHSTGTSLQPDIVNDKEWVEAKTLLIIKQCLAVNLKEERYNQVLDLAPHIDSYIKLLAKNGRSKRAFEIINLIGDSIINSVAPVSDSDIVDNEIIEKLAIIAWVASMPVVVSLAHREYIEAVSTEKVLLGISKITWIDHSSIYKQGFPFHYLARLEWLKSRLAFELAVEEKLVTPIWYQYELLIQIEADLFVENTEAIINQGIHLYNSWISRATHAKHPWLVGALISGEWEFWHKVDNQMKVWPHIWLSLSGERKIEGLPWSEFGYETLQLKSKRRRSALLGLMATQNLLLAFLKRPEGFPDYTGQFLHASGEVAVEALLGNDESLLNNVFPAYLSGCIMRFDALRPKNHSIDWRVTQEFKIASAALLDLMELSGYGRLMADYHNNQQLWDIVRKEWDKYLEEATDNSILALLAASIALTSGLAEIPHRATLRTSWKMRINDLLMSIPRQESDSISEFPAGNDVDHESPLVRVFAGGTYGSFHDGIDIFIIFYLIAVSVTDQLDFGWKSKRLQETLKKIEDADVLKK